MAWKYRVKFHHLTTLRYMNLGKSLNLSAIQVPYPKWEQHSAYLLYFLVKTKRHIRKVLRTAPGASNSINVSLIISFGIALPDHVLHYNCFRVLTPALRG